MKIIVYTAITGGKDAPRKDITCFTGEGLFSNPVMEAKIYKCLPHLFLPDHDVSIWIDGNIFLNVDPEIIVDKYLPMYHHLFAFRHFERKCIYKELAVLRNIPKFYNNPTIMRKFDEQMIHYGEFFTENYGLWECNFLIRRNSWNAAEFNAHWWAEICRWQERDQISFPVIVEKTKDYINFNSCEGNVRNHEYFTYKNHVL